MSERRVGVWRLRVRTGYSADGKPVQRSKAVKGNRREAQTEPAKFVAEAEPGAVSNTPIDRAARANVADA